MSDTAPSTSDGRMPELRCAHCGKPLTYRQTRGAFMHEHGAVASCDLDSDHQPEPDWSTVGRVPCRVCAADVEASRDGVFRHVDTSREGEHAPDPDLPVSLRAARAASG
jgi:hypothetical protein